MLSLILKNDKIVTFWIPSLTDTVAISANDRAT